MPPDNASTVAPGADINFPQDGPNYNGDISRTSSSSFSLGKIGRYLVMFQVSVDGAGQLLVILNGNDLEYTVAGNATALIITPLAGGTRPVSAHLVILRIE